MIHGILGSLPGPEKVPLLVRIAQNLRHSRVLLVNGMKFAQFASSFFCSSGPGKTLLLVRIAQNLCHLRLLLANGVKFAQFVSNSCICLQKTN